MELLNNLSLVFSVALTFQNLAMCFDGCLVGTLIVRDMKLLEAPLKASGTVIK